MARIENQVTFLSIPLVIASKALPDQAMLNLLPVLKRVVFPLNPEPSHPQFPGFNSSHTIPYKPFAMSPSNRPSVAPSHSTLSVLYVPRPSLLLPCSTDSNCLCMLLPTKERVSRKQEPLYVAVVSEVPTTKPE